MIGQNDYVILHEEMQQISMHELIGLRVGAADGPEISDPFEPSEANGWQLSVEASGWETCL